MKKLIAVCFTVLVCCSIPIKTLASATELTSTKAEQQNTKKIRIVGLIKDSEGEPAIGVTIQLKGTTVSTITDVEGNYVIKAPENGTLVFKYVGMKTEEIEIQGRGIIDLTLSDDKNMLEEFVAVGYGSQRKISTIGAQSGIKNISELKQPVSNITSVLAGRIAGVVTRQKNGEAGKDDNTDIWIRGISTTTDSSPLVLVDGVERSFGSINPEDIESFQILKDASATAIYGVKGANGVILIGTKKGEKGKPQIQADYSSGITNFTKVPDLADGITYMQMANEASMTRGGSPVYSEESISKTATGADPYVYPNTNWMKEIFSDYGKVQKFNANVGGGSDFSKYYVSLGYYNESGLYKTNAKEQYDGKMNYNRYNFVSNLTMDITKTTELDLGVIGEVATYITPYYSAASIFNEIMDAYPTLYPVLYPDGELPYLKTGGEVSNPYGMLHRTGYNERNTCETRSNLTLKQNLDFIVKGLSFKGLFAYDYYNRSDLQRANTVPVTYYATGRDKDDQLILKRTDDFKGVDYLGFTKNIWGHRQYYMEGSLSYNQTFDNSKHRVNGLLLYNQTDYSNITANNLNESLPYRSLGLAGRATYSYEDRYFSEINFGYNGSENFAPDKRFGFFPSLGFAWVPSNETFLEGMKPYIQYMKFRGSWGKAGNSSLNANRRFAYLSTVGSGNGGYTFGKTRSNSFGGKDINDIGVDVTWETSTKSNLGVDLNVWNNDLTFQFDVFQETRENIFLTRAAVPNYIGLLNNTLGNLGIIDNHGFEATVDLTKHLGDWTLMFKGNYSFSKNKVIEDDTPAKPYQWLETRGRSLYVPVGYICQGLYTQQEIDDPNVPKPGGVYQAGDLKYKDLNNDGILDGNDKTALGYPDVPQVVYGLGMTINYKNFTLGAFFQGVSKIDISINTSNFIPFRDATAKGNLFANITDRWTVENPSQEAKWPRLAYGANINENYATSSYWLRSGDYLRLKTLDFGYNIPTKLTKKYGINAMRLYFLGYNVFTFSDFDMWDVELGSGSGAAYPNVRTYSLGLNFSF